MNTTQSPDTHSLPTEEELPWAHGLALGLSTGVGLGGIVGLLLIPFVPGAIREIFVIFGCMGAGSIIGGAIGLLRQFGNSR